ncbi:MAG: Spy/CpxP family protein refolding chaperone [Vampirovibrionia bacterium]
MLKKISITALSCLFALFIWNSQSFAQQMDNDDFGPPQQEGMGMRGHGGHMGPGGHGGKDHGLKSLLKELNLTEEQKALAKKQREAAKGQIKSIKEQLRPEMEKMMDLMANPNVTKQEMFAQIDKVGKLQTEMHKIRAANFIELKNTLTPEQKAKFQELAAKKKAKMKEMMSKMKERREQRRPQFNPEDDEN